MVAGAAELFGPQTKEKGATVAPFVVLKVVIVLLFLLFSQLLQQIVQVQRTCVHVERAIRVLGPLFLRPVPVQFHPVLVGIGEVDGFRYTMVRCTCKRITGFDESLYYGCQIFPGRVQNGRMKKPGAADWRWGAIFALPGV